MSTTLHQTNDHVHVETTLQFLDRFFQKTALDDFAIRLWEGTTWQAGQGNRPRFTLVLNHPGALRRMFLNQNELAVAEAYVYGDFDVEGDLDAVFELYMQLEDTDFSWWDRLQQFIALMRLPQTTPQEANVAARMRGKQHSQERDRNAIQHHYDVSNDFYQLFLDEHMVYSCAYFTSFENDIHTAQRDKLDHICRKLRLQPGERLLDIGCGWGGLVIHAAREYGVHATGITLSENQLQETRKRIEEAGVQDRACVELVDYREVDANQLFDKTVSVGMVEHVGRQKLPEYFKQVWRVLKPGGLFLNHGISGTLQWAKAKSPFIQKYVFPDGELIPVSEMNRYAEQVGFEVRDVESLREHYAETLRHWTRRLETNEERARQFVSEATYRVWRLYMAASRYTFLIGRNNLHQTLLYKPDGWVSNLPPTRADLYE